MFVCVCEPYGVIPCLGALKVLKVNVCVCVNPNGVIPCLGALIVLKLMLVCVNPMESFHV